MKKKIAKALLVGTALIFSFALLLADKESFKLNQGYLDKNYAQSSVRFQSYSGRTRKYDSVGAIENIGRLLAQSLTAQPGTKVLQNANKYSVRRIMFKGHAGYAADLIALNSLARVDRSINLSIILKGYLSQAFGYSPEQSASLAKLIMTYNALLRKKVSQTEEYRDYLQSSVSSKEYKNLGLSLNWKLWAGNSLVVIPLIADKSGNIVNLNQGKVIETAMGVKSAPKDVVYVSSGKSAEPNGLTWKTAFNDLQKAINFVAGSNGKYKEIWVAQGTYAPSSQPAYSSPKNSPRYDHFMLRPNVAVYGGFTGKELVRAGRDPSIYKTTLSGKLPNGKGNVYHVLYQDGSADVSSALLDGFVISGGLADGDKTSSESRGAGVYITKKPIELRNDVITNNKALYGGGLYVQNVGISPSNVAGKRTGKIDSRWLSLTGVGFVKNTATYGGALYSFQSNVYLKNINMSLNTADKSGGALYGMGSYYRVTSGAFESNEALGGLGGAFAVVESQLMLSGAMFNTNTASLSGGAVAVLGGKLTTDAQVSFNKNTSGQRGGALYIEKSPSDLQSVVFKANTAKVSGGALSSKLAPVHLYNAYLAGNGAPSGTSVAFDGGAIGIYQTTILPPSAPKGASKTPVMVGSVNSDGAMTVQNSVLWSSDGSTDPFSAQSASTQTISYVDQSKASFASDAQHVMSKDPTLTLKNGFMVPDAGSPAIDSGTLDLTGYDLSDKDLAGNRRISAATVDLGAFEAQS